MQFGYLRGERRYNEEKGNEFKKELLSAMTTARIELESYEDEYILQCKS